jgi:hypothetical protein
VASTNIDGEVPRSGMKADPEQIGLANYILGGRVVSVQNQFSPAFRSSEPELELGERMGIAFSVVEPTRWNLGHRWSRLRQALGIR